jgi:hypothetical protein
MLTTAISAISPWPPPASRPPSAPAPRGGGGTSQT